MDLTGSEVIDAHCHPFRTQDLLDREPGSFETRCMFLGTALLSSNHANLEAAAFVEEMTETTMFGLALRRWIARHLGCEPTKEAVVAARDAALRADPPGYVRGLLESEGFVAVVADEGYPQPTIAREEFEAALGGVTVHRVGRIEPWIVDAREEGTFDGTVQRFEDDRERRRRRPAADRVQDDHRLPHRPRHHRPDVGRCRRGVRPLARRRLARVARAREARARLPAATRVRAREATTTGCSTCTWARATPT